ncbi:carbon storage regulator CsrA [Caenibacillus caldisaponilyticus]|uniref:carbon storage regulator CsrA n=1 Tax=Caenibacillus caldisaponilyticus TaxID=1674942 RepID=UPI0009888D00|nr:carbon storage regulator CsrA [Caenibacillus caldisaponilyticus]
MLVLTRKTNESLMIGDRVEIEVLAIDGDQVKLGIRAPRDVDIHRKEIYLEIKKANDEAAATDLSANAIQALKRLKGSE